MSCVRLCLGGTGAGSKGQGGVATPNAFRSLPQEVEYTHIQINQEFQQYTINLSQGVLHDTFILATQSVSVTHALVGCESIGFWSQLSKWPTFTRENWVWTIGW